MLAAWKDRLFRRRGSNKYLVLLFGAIFLYLFFFATGFILPYSGKLYETPLRTTAKLSGHTALTLKRWEYDPTRQLMEVELVVEDSYQNYRTVLTPTAMTRKLAPLPVQIIVSSRELLVLQITAIPARFEAVALTVATDTGDTPVKFYCDVRSVTQNVLPTRSETEYKQISLEADAAWLESQLQEGAAAIEAHTQNIRLYQSDVEVLEQEMQGQNAASRQQTEQFIRQKKLEIEGELTRITQEQERQKILAENLVEIQKQLKKS